jgi:hypothetical protein
MIQISSNNAIALRVHFWRKDAITFKIPAVAVDFGKAVNDSKAV